jgi:outer membrane protein TolC
MRRNFYKGIIKAMKRTYLFLVLVPAIMGTAFKCHALSLSKAQEMMFSKNLDIIISSQEYCKKDMELSEANTFWYPSVDADGYYSYQNKKNTITLPIKSVYLPSGALEIGTYDKSDIGLDISYPLTSALVNIYNVKHARIGVQVKSYQNEALKNQLSFKLASMYLLWDFSFCKANMQKVLITQMDAAVIQLQTLKAGGMVSSARILEARAKLENARLELCTDENTTDSLRREITDLIQCGDINITPENYDFGIDSELVAGLDTISLDPYRPEITALDLSVDQLSVMLDILSGQKYPNFVLTAGYHYGRPELNMGTDPDYMGYATAAVKFNFNLFNGDRTTIKQRQTQQQIEIVKMQRTQMINTLNNSIKSAKQDFLRAIKRKKAARLSLDAADTLVTDLKNSLMLGTVTSVDYLSSLSSRAAAEYSLKQAEFMEKIAILKLFFASGKKLKY